jgi:hypothetical protein
MAEKQKFMFGQVTVTTVTVETETQEQGEAEAKEWFKKPELKEGKKDIYILPWTEGGAMDTTEERNKVLAGFLELMQKVIPMTPCDKVKLILLPNQKIIEA